jgi:hypothetical protein
MPNQIDLSNSVAVTINVPIAWSTEYALDADTMEVELCIEDKHHILTAVRFLDNNAFIDHCVLSLDLHVYVRGKDKFDDDNPRCGTTSVKVFNGYMHAYAQGKYDSAMQYESEAIRLAYEKWGEY